MIFKSVAIVGAGFSGSLLAINILRHAGPQATLMKTGGKPLIVIAAASLTALLLAFAFAFEFVAG